MKSKIWWLTWYINKEKYCCNYDSYEEALKGIDYWAEKYPDAVYFNISEDKKIYAW